MMVSDMTVPGVLVPQARELKVVMAARRVLIVEDDRDIQNVIGNTLDESGFDLAFTDSGEAAVTLLNGLKDHYSAIVIDIALRGRMSGWEVGTHARQVSPDFPVIYITGLYADQWLWRGVPNSIMLTKPFAVEQLVVAISGLLTR